MLTREELYSLVWSVPGGTAAKRLGVSGSYLGRVCRALDVPRPPRGWWRKVETGDKTAPPLLPVVKPGFPQQWEKARTATAPIRPYYRGSVASPPEQGSNLHPLIQLASAFYAGASTSDGIYLSPRRSAAIDLTCTAETLKDALALADALFKRLESCGHVVAIAPGHGLTRPAIENWVKPIRYTRRIPLTLSKPKAPTIAIILGIPIGLAVMEISEEAEMRYLGHGEFERASKVKKVAGITWTEWQRVPIGRLMLVAYSPHFPCPWQRVWAMKRRKSLARTAEAIVAELESLAPTLPHANFFLGTTSR